ncbi:MAG: protein kinase, partial [Verrucomicrobiaceae bacterium]|nr:protein kinase [Verrucomicrobiaceae bacterium]
MSSSIPASTPGKIWQPPTAEELQPELPAYEILGLLGRGGMGAVYKARQKSLNREVAIKVLPPMAAEDDGAMHFAERFKAEAQSMARLEHPGIVAVYDAGETPGGLLYFVMQYVQGTDVSQMIRSAGRLPPEHVHAIAAHVCDALAYAHANGLIHRDIKPANIMVDTQGRVKVADFGLAKAVDAQTGFTQSNMAVGTPDFVAPEALIPGVPVDGRADLYAVGVMLYQMLTGQIPRGAWQPASVVAPGTDVRFDQIIEKAMAYDREQRHHSATELRQHLDTLLMPAVPAPDLQAYSSAQMPKAAPPPPERKTSFPTRSQPPGGAAAKKNEADKNVHSTSKTPLLIGLGAAAAIGIGAFVMFSGGEKAKQSSPLAPASGTRVAAAPNPSPTPTPVKVIEPVKVKPAKPAPPAEEKEEPKPPAMAASSGRAAGPPAAASGPSATKTEPAPAAPKGAQSGPLSPLSGTSGPAAANTPPTAAQGTERATLPPELAALDAQFIALQKERVTAPFEADVAKLNTSYLGGIGKKIAEEKAAGHLDAILALEAEKQTVERVFNSFSAGGATAGNELKTR